MHRLFYLLILLSFSSPTKAAEVTHLYQSSTPVKTQSIDERNEKAATLFKQVLIKLVGDESILDENKLKPILANAQASIQQYEYIDNNALRHNPTTSDDLSLKLTFDKSAVDNVLKQLNLPKWGKVRPDILVWISSEVNGERTLQGLENMPQSLFLPLQNVSDQRGLPILIPLNDLEDLKYVNADKVGAVDESAIQKASQRYKADDVLVMNIKQKNNQTMIRWQLGFGDSSIKWTSEGFNDAAIKKGFAFLVNTIAKRYKSDSFSSDEQTIHIVIQGVNNYADFNRVFKTVNDIDEIDSVKTESINGGILKLVISFSGDGSTLKRLLEVGNVLSSVDKTVTTVPSADQIFRLLP